MSHYLITLIISSRAKKVTYLELVIEIKSFLKASAPGLGSCGLRKGVVTQCFSLFSFHLAVVCGG